MAQDQAIDILQEFVDLYAREDMLGFFGFTLNRPGGKPIAGLCRMSKPKSADANMPYVSLTFVVDTPGDQGREVVEAALGEIDGDRLKQNAPGVTDVVSVPVMSAGNDNYVSQIDILLAEGTDVSHRFVGGTLLPALRNLAGLSLGDIVWWDEIGPGEHTSAAAALSNESLLASVKTYLSGYFKADKA